MMQFQKWGIGAVVLTLMAVPVFAHVGQDEIDQTIKKTSKGIVIEISSDNSKVVKMLHKRADVYEEYGSMGCPMMFGKWSRSGCPMMGW